MDSYTILCVYEQMVHQYMSDNNIRDQLVDEPLLLTTISNVLADVCKKMDAQKFRIRENLFKNLCDHGLILKHPTHHYYYHYC